MKFGRIMILVGIVATLGLVAAGVQGYGGAREGAALREHILLGLVALLLFVLAHCWVLVYLVGIDRVLRRAPRDAGRDEAPEPRLRTFRGLTLSLLLAAVLGGVVAFVLGTEVYSGRVSAGLHGAFLWLTVVLQAAAVAVEWRALAASERALRKLQA
jgi:hypothetical protein